MKSNNSVKPTFLGLGVQKGATSWINSILQEHPEIGMAQGNEKDKMFFNFYFDRGYLWYTSHFNHCHNKKAIGEYSTSYFYSAEAPERVHEYIPTAKLIVCLRDPVERAYSNHKHEISIGRLSTTCNTFEDAVRQNPMYLRQSLYSENLSRWLTFFPKEQMLILVFEDLKKDPGAFAKTIYDFLGVDTGFCPAVLHKKVNESRVKKNLKLHTTRRKVVRYLKDKGFGVLIETAKHLGLKSYLDKKNEVSVDTVVPPLEEQTRHELQKYFYEDKCKIEKLIGRQLHEWQ